MSEKAEGGGLFYDGRVEVFAAERHARLSHRRFQRAEVADAQRAARRLDNTTMYL